MIRKRFPNETSATYVSHKIEFGYNPFSKQVNPTIVHYAKT